MSECEHDWWDDDDRCEKFCPKCGVYHVAELQAELDAIKEKARAAVNAPYEDILDMGLAQALRELGELL